MADDPEEAADITSICNALVVNIGTLNQHTIPSMFFAAQRANELNHPVVLDPVGAGASPLRTNTAHRLLDSVNFTDYSRQRLRNKGSGARRKPPQKE